MSERHQLATFTSTLPKQKHVRRQPQASAPETNQFALHAAQFEKPGPGRPVGHEYKRRLHVVDGKKNVGCVRTRKQATSRLLTKPDGSGAAFLLRQEIYLQRVGCQTGASGTFPTIRSRSALTRTRAPNRVPNRVPNPRDKSATPAVLFHLRVSEQNVLVGQAAALTTDV